MKTNVRKSRFTLIEIMVSMGVFLILLTLLLNFFSGTRQVWKNLRQRNDSYEKARVAMDIITDLMTTSVADNSEIGFWAVKPHYDDDGNLIQGSCTFLTRTTRNLTEDASSNELDNYYLVSICMTEPKIDNDKFTGGELKLLAQRLNLYNGSLNSKPVFYNGGNLVEKAKENVIIRSVSGLSFKNMVNSTSGKRDVAIEITMHIFDSEENLKKYTEISDETLKKEFKAAHEYVFTRVISFEDISEPVYEVKNDNKTEN